MKKQKIGFKGEIYQETSLEDYVNHWVLLKFRNGHSTFGYLKGLNKKEGNLLPYCKVTYDKQGNFEHIITESGLPDTYERLDIVGYRTSSKEEAEGFCEKMNRDNYISSMRERKEMFELESINEEISKKINEKNK